MVRMQIVVGILALSVGVLGCGDDDNGSGGTGGTAGTGDTAGTGGMAGTGGTGGTAGTGGTGGGGLTTACNEEPDLSAATSIEFAGQFWGCYDAADGDIALSVETCLAETPGLSTACSDCYGEYATCIDTNCAESCNDRGTNTLPCSQCVVDPCNLDLTSCSGVGFPAVVPQQLP